MLSPIRCELPVALEVVERFDLNGVPVSGPFGFMAQSSMIR